MKIRAFSFLIACIVFSHAAVSQESVLDCSLIDLPSYICATNDPQDEPTLFVPDQLATLTSDAHQLIGGVLSPLSGNPCLRETDFIVKGAQEISLSRVYIAPYMPYRFHKHWDEDCAYRRSYLHRHYEGWKHFPHLQLWFDYQKKEAHLVNPSGATYDFSIANGQTTLLHSHASTNIGDLEIPSGRFDPKNTRISCNGTNVTVFSPDGSTRYYALKSGKGRTLLLEKEILPNGKILKFQYNNGKLAAVESLDPKERYVYATITCIGSPDEGDHTFTCSTGLNSSSHFDREFYSGKFHENKKLIKYSGCTPPLMTTTASPQYREESVTYTSPQCLLHSFSGKEKVFSVIHEAFGDRDKAHFRVEKLLLPVGQDDSFIAVHQMSYQPAIAGEKEGKTTVKNSDGTSIVYHFSKNLLVTLMQYLGADGSLKKEKIFTWNDKNWLTSIELRDGHQHLFFRKSYEYDSFGNPITEVYSGDLQGAGRDDNYTIKREFSQDGRNLLLKEETEEGKVTLFEYLPNTNLLTQKLTKVRDHLLLREVRQYDDCHNVIRKSIDDGNGQMRLTDYILRSAQPFLHMPEWVEEKYLDQGKEKLLKRTQLLYDVWGHVQEERVHDADANYVYSIFKEYNERGDILSETNPLGYRRTFTYDSKGRCIESTPFSQKIKEEMRYDTKGRLLEKKEIGSEGIHTTCYAYDPTDHLIQKIDEYHNSISYSYDPLVHKVTTSEFPARQIGDGEISAVVTHSTYDALGRELSKTDANGNLTHYRYNAYGLPTEINYPNGSQELFRYCTNGKIKTHTNKDGLTTHFTFDVLGRVTSKIYERIGKESYSYDSFNLVESVDLEGHTTHYTYDGAGRKIQEKRCGKITAYFYDSLGRVETIQKDALLTRFKRDLEDRVIEENKNDLKGTLLYKIGYSYTPAGELERVIRYINGKKAIEQLTYDAFGREISHQDPLGHTTHTIYDERHLNSLGQTVLQVTTIDPEGTATTQIHDPFFQVVKEETLDPNGAVIAAWDKIYDPNGNVLLWKEHVYEEGQYKNTQSTQFTYTCDNKIQSNTRAFGTPDARTLYYTYTPSGHVETKTLADGAVLIYSYDRLGFLRHLSSSDGTINHRFECTKNGELTDAFDEVEKIAIHREIDPFGNVIRELFPSSIEVSKSYDPLDRLTTLQINGIGSIAYEYDPVYLRKVSRLSPNGQVHYTHHYDAYDLDGNLLSERLIYACGSTEHKHDLKGRKIEIASPYFSQKCLYDACDNLIQNTLDQTKNAYKYDHLSQLIAENATTYRYDSLLNRIEKDNKQTKINDLNELSDQTYDLNGNLIQKDTTHYTYDHLNRLTEASLGSKRIRFLYDPLGRRLTKQVFNQTSKGWDEAYSEHYIYNGQEEIGAISSDGTLKNLRVLGLNTHEKLPMTVAIEMNQKTFAPTMDVHNNICRLVDPLSKKIVSTYTFTSFGEETSNPNDQNPWRWAAKRFDPELNLIYFGKRYYDPDLGRWLTTDPAGFADSLNLYQYAFNNPHSYYDPNGEFLFSLCIPLSLLFNPVVWNFVVEAAIFTYEAYGMYQTLRAINTAVGNAYTPSEELCYDVLSHVHDHTKVDRSKKEDKEKNYPGKAKDLEKNPDWYETTHPDDKTGNRTFENKKTGEKIRYDKGKPGETGHKAKDHYHRYNPKAPKGREGKSQRYLDKDGNPVPEHSEKSHLYPPEGETWD